MPRQARLDAPGALHHVMGRRIEGISGKQRISEGMRKLLTGYVAGCYSKRFLESVTIEESPSPQTRSQRPDFYFTTHRGHFHKENLFVDK